MSSRLKLGIGVVSVVAVCAVAFAVETAPATPSPEAPVAPPEAAKSEGGPYQAIIERNVFSLKPPPPPAPDPSTLEPPKPPMPPTTLNGVANITGRDVAMLKVVMPASAGAAGKPAEGAKEKSFMLGAGEREGEIEVLKIDMARREVAVVIFGTTTNLNFKANGPKGPPPAAAAQAAGGAPGGAAAAMAPAAGNPGFRGLPPNTARQMRMGGAGDITSPGNGYAAAGPQAVAPVNNQPGAQAVQANSGQLTAEQSILAMELERERTKDLVSKGLMPPIPPTVMTPQEGNNNQGQPELPGNNEQFFQPNRPGMPTLPRR